MNLSDFYTRKKAGEGEKLPLRLPDGTPTDEWLLIRGIDSDEVRLASDRYRRAVLLNAAIEDEVERERKNRDELYRLQASHIAGWSFSEEMTEEALIELLREAPYIGDEADRLASDRTRFFRKGSTNSEKD